ncbi:MAG: hypothetical protein ACAI35_07030 [Candidatus Methylacidiphilales bacterium]|nr:hypothetical protein [Candidatus Methylacidiphilales bacterium]
MPLFEILFVIALLLAGGGLFYGFYRVSTAPPRPLEEYERLAVDTRPLLKFTSPYDYLRRAYFTPFLIIIPIALVIFSAREERMAYFQLYIYAAIQLYFLSSCLQRGCVRINNRLILREEDPATYWQGIRYLYFIYFGMMISLVGIVVVSKYLFAWWMVK